MESSLKGNSESDLIISVKQWNSKFPFDIIWRRKFNIPFMSDSHRKMCLFDIKFDYTEDLLIKQLIAEDEISKKLKEIGKNIDEQLFKSSVVEKNTREQTLKDFEDFDINSL